MIYELIIKVLINVLLIFILISVFFFTYGVYIEQTVITNQMKILSDNFVDTFRLFGKKSSLNLNNNITNNLLSQESIAKLEKDDATALEGNKNIITMVIIYVSIFIIIVGIVIFMIKKYETQKEPEEMINLKAIFIESSIIILFIGLTEYIFLTFFGAKFISIDTNSVKLSIIKNLKKYSSSLDKIYS